MQQNVPKPFGKIRAFLWPIHSHELKRLGLMFALFFLISFVYNLLRCLKISLILTAPGSGVEVIPYVKTCAVLPGAVFFTFMFTKLVSKFSRAQVFYSILSGFLIYFILFLFFICPYHQELQLDTVADFLQKTVLRYSAFNGLVALIRHWDLTLFYVACEMWSAVVLSMLFWGFANEVTKVHEAKRFYAIFALGANSSSIFSGQFAKLLASLSYCSFMPYSEANQWIFYQMMSVILIGFVIVWLFHILDRSIIDMEKLQSLDIPKRSVKISLTECFAYLMKSKYLAYLVMIVVGYNIVYHLSDLIWNDKVRQMYSDSKNFNVYINNVSSLTGAVAVVFAFIISGNVIRRYGWGHAAIITPVIWLISGLFFYAGILLQHANMLDSFCWAFSNPANLILALGSAQICFGRACKYTVFDETKEIVFIPLPKHEQRKCKAIVDGLASRFGKSGGAMIYLFLMFALQNNKDMAVPYVIAIIIVVIALWIIAVIGLSKMVNISIDEEEVQQDIQVAKVSAEMADQAIAGKGHKPAAAHVKSNAKGQQPVNGLTSVT